MDILNDISKHTIDLVDNIDDIEQKYQDYQTTHSIERREQDMIAIEKDVEKSIQDVEIIYTDVQKIYKPSTQSSWWF
jgi:ornithine carbamoyltransferase